MIDFDEEHMNNIKSLTIEKKKKKKKKKNQMLP